ncbi:fasciclin-like arabinogalactan protein 6 [Typha angustifolia]|uniref:fasciclin-like arabinogalactan protein 6 n=1 Tax=Typha angustifolia TaxID=59011 RepID=UPI003C2F9E17
MASSKLLLFPLTTLLLLLATPRALAATPVAPGPTPAPLNLTGILAKGGQYTTLLRLLDETQVSQQLISQLNSSFNGLTLFAPTDNAFSSLKAGTLNSLTNQEQVQLVLYHVLPRYYSLTTFQTSSNPISTQASGDSGVYTVNVTSTSNQVNVSTGVNDAPINNVLYSEFPLAVYSVDSVLLPAEIFGVKPPAPAPTAGTVPSKHKKTPVSSTAAAPAEEADSSTNAARGRSAGWAFVLGFGFMSIVSLF